MRTAPCPLAALFEAHEQTLRCCESLQRLVFLLGQCPPDAASTRQARRLVDHFDHLVEAQHPLERRLLHPALRETVRGSDAACLRELTDAMAHEQRAIEVLWRRLRDEVAAIARGESPPLVVTDADAFVRLVRSHTEHAALEVLPLVLQLCEARVLQRVAAAFAESGHDDPAVLARPGLPPAHPAAAAP